MFRKPLFFFSTASNSSYNYANSRHTIKLSKQCDTLIAPPIETLSISWLSVSLASFPTFVDLPAMWLQFPRQLRLLFPAGYKNRL